MVGVGILGAFLTILVFAFRREEEIEVPAQRIAASRELTERGLVHECRGCHRRCPSDAPSSPSEAGPAPKRIVVAYGFWIFLLSDIVMFSALFAAYAMLAHATAGGPTGAELFNQAASRSRPLVSSLRATRAE